MNAVLVFVLLQGAAAAPEVPPAAQAEHAAGGETILPTRFEPRPAGVGLHLGLNATLTVDAELGDLFYGAFATQLTGIGSAFAPDAGFVLSGFLMGGVALPLRETTRTRLTLDVGPHLTLLRTAPVNALAGGLVAGVRMVWSNGLTVAVKLPVAGYAGSLDQPRGGVLYYYVAAVPTVPLLSVGYTF